MTVRSHALVISLCLLCLTLALAVPNTFAQRTGPCQLVELSHRDRFTGVVRVVSDVPVIISATQVTENLDGEPVEVELSVISPIGRTDFVPFQDGDGMATEIVLINPTERAAAGTLQFFSGAGAPRDMIVR